MNMIQRMIRGTPPTKRSGLTSRRSWLKICAYPTNLSGHRPGHSPLTLRRYPHHTRFRHRKKYIYSYSTSSSIDAINASRFCLRFECMLISIVVIATTSPFQGQKCEMSSDNRARHKIYARKPTIILRLVKITESPIC